MIRAAHDFALCTRRPQSCSLHADCARAQFGTRNPQLQAFVAPVLTGDACSIFYDFAPFRQLAANGGGIADTMAESENLGRSEQSGAAHREDAGGSGSAVKLPARNEDRAGSGVTAGAGPSSAPVYPDNFRTFAGPHRQATTDHPAACGLLSAGEHQQLRAARLLNL